MSLPILIFSLGFWIVEATLNPGQRPSDAWIGVVFVLAGAPLLLNVVVFYRMWNQIQDGRPRMSAQMAVALMYIPILQFYGQFHAFYGLAQDLNEYTGQRNIQGTRTPAWAAMVFCICLCVVGAPLMVGLVLAPFSFLGGLAFLGLSYLFSIVVGPILGIFGQVSWWCMIAQSASIARAKRGPAPSLPTNRFGV